MKTNIRLFVPNTTEALDFEYGLLIHYMKYNEYRSQAEIGLQYYELADIDPIDNALDIVQQQVITDTTRGQSKIDGFTLDSHYTLSFNQRLNNKIEENSVRQTWLWLNCKNPKYYHFLLEKFTDTEQKIVSDQNQLFVRLWRHPEWMEHDIDAFDQGKLDSCLELISVVKQRLETQFDQIEQLNRQKVLAELNIKKINTTPVVMPEAPVAEYKPKPIIDSKSNLIEGSVTSADIENKYSLEERLLWILKCYSAVNYHVKGGIPLEKLNNARTNYFFDQNDAALALIDTTVFGGAKTGMVIGLKGVYFKNAWKTKTLKNFISWKDLSSNRLLFNNADYGYIKLMEGCVFNACVGDFRKEKIIEMLNKIISVHDGGILQLDYNKKAQEIPKQNLNQPPKLDSSIRATTPSDKPDTIEKPKMATWWIWLIFIFFGFIFHPTVGGLFLVIAIVWSVLRLVFSSRFLFRLILMAITFGMIYVMNHF